MFRDVCMVQHASSMSPARRNIRDDATLTLDPDPQFDHDGIRQENTINFLLDDTGLEKI